MADTAQNSQTTLPTTTTPPPPLSKTARKKLLKQERQAERKAAKKAAEKARHRELSERRRREWDERLAAASQDERERLVQERLAVRAERVGRRNEEKEAKAERLKKAAESGQKVVVDLDFPDLMRENEIHSLTQQIMYCYAVNGRSSTPAHLWLTGLGGELATQFQRLPGFDKWKIEKQSMPYLEVFQDCKEDLVYLTADAEAVLDDLDPKKIYIIGGLVDRNRWKGITMKRANEQGIQSAKLPIGNYLKMSSSQVLTVNQVFEIMLKFLETKDWSSAFFHVIPQRKREAEAAVDDVDAEGSMTMDAAAKELEVVENEQEDQEEKERDDGNEEEEDDPDKGRKRQCISVLDKN